MNLFELFVKVGVDDQASGKVEKLSEKLGNGLKTAAKVGIAAVGAAATAIGTLTTMAVKSFAEYEQLAGGAAKIFDEMSQTEILKDAQNAYKELGLSANQYLAVINDVGATFAATMGDAAGYEAAKTGLKAISDYASGTGKNVDELSQKFTLITRSTSSYQSIADQFSGILPATSAGFLEQAQAAGILSDSYTQLTEVPIDEYQAAVSQMLEKGVKDLGLFDNTVNEAFSTLSGSLSMAKGAWSNLVTGLADGTADLDPLIENLVTSVEAVITNVVPKIGVALNSTIKLVRDLIPVIVQEIPLLIEQNLPLLAEAAVGLVQALIDGISSSKDTLINTVLEVALFLVDSFIGVLPQIAQLGMDILVTLAEGIAESIPQLVPTVIQVILEIARILTDPTSLGRIIDAAVVILGELANGLIEAIPNIITAAIEIILGLVNYLLEPSNLAKLIDGALGIITSLVGALMKSVEPLLKAAIEIIMALVRFLHEPANLEKLITAAIDIVVTLMNAIVDSVYLLVDAAVALILTLVEFLLAPERIQQMLEAGAKILIAIVEGLLSKMSNVDKAGKEFIDKLWEKLTSVDWASLGKGVIDGILGGLKSAWNTLSSWVSDAWNSLFGDKEDDFVSTTNSSEYEKIKAMKSGQISPGGYINPNAQPLGSTVNVTQNIYSSAKTPSELMTEAYYQQKLGAMN